MKPACARGGRRARVLIPAATTAGTAAALVFLRLAYFGLPLPNTYYAKLGNDHVHNIRSGLAYFADFARANPALFVCLASGLICFAGIIRRKPADRRRGVVARLTGLIGLGFIVPILMGGDHFGAFRLFQPIWPLLVLPVLWIAPRLATPSRGGIALTGRLAAYVLPLVTVALMAMESEAKWWRLNPLELRHEFQIAADGRAAGARLARIFEERGRPDVGVIAAGGFKLGYPGVVRDLMGMNDRRMARAGGERRGDRGHAAFNADVFYDLQPDGVIVQFKVDRGRALAPPPNSFEDQALKGLLHDDRFRSEYVLASIGRVENPDEQVAGYFRRLFLDSLDATGAFAVERREGLRGHRVRD